MECPMPTATSYPLCTPLSTPSATSYLHYLRLLPPYLIFLSYAIYAFCHLLPRPSATSDSRTAFGQHFLVLWQKCFVRIDSVLAITIAFTAGSTR